MWKALSFLCTHELYLSLQLVLQALSVKNILPAFFDP